MIALWRGSALVATLVVGVGFGFPPNVGATSEPECVVAAAWVAENFETLPTDYDEFVTFPRVYRTAIYSVLSTDEKVALWEEHLHLFRAEHTLSTEQDRFLETVTSNLPTYIEAGPSAEVEALEAEARALLGGRLARAAIATLGPVQNAVAGEACSCSGQSDWCDSGYRCGSDSDGCDTNGGCGTMLVYNCDGECLS